MPAKLVMVHRTGAMATVRPHCPSGDLIADACAALCVDRETLISTLLPGEAQRLVDIAHDLWTEKAHQDNDPDEIRAAWENYLERS